MDKKERLEWVKGYEGIYIITSWGRLFSMTRRDSLFRVLMNTCKAQIEEILMAELINS